LLHLVDMRISKVGWGYIADGIGSSLSLNTLRINKCDLKITNLEILVPGIVLN